MKRLFLSFFVVLCVWITASLASVSMVSAQVSTPSISCDPFGYNANCVSPTPSPSPLALAVAVRSIKNSTNIITAVLGGSVFALNIPFFVARIFPQIMHFFRFLGSLFAFHKKKDYWGIVIDSDFGKPIAGVTVQAFDVEFHQLKETQKTGTHGQLNFTLQPGRYSLIVQRTGFLFPARKQPPITLRDREKIYSGEEFTVVLRGVDAMPRLAIPLDLEARVSPSRTVFLRTLGNIFASVDTIGFVLMFLAAAVNTYFLILSPDTLNIICEVLYLILFVLQFYVLLAYKRGVGIVQGSTTKETIDRAVVRFYETSTNRIVQTRVTNKKGRFSFCIPRGDYAISVSCAGYETYVVGNIHVHGSAPKAASLNVSLKKK